MKAHLLDSDEPLTSGIDYVARCGKNISKAHFVMSIEWGGGGLANLSTLLFCAKCMLLPHVIPGKRYLYGMVDGEKTKHFEDGE